MFKIVIDSKNDNKTLGEYIETLAISVQRKKQLLNNNTCYINKVLSSKEDILKENDLLEIDLSIFEIQKYKPVESNLTILYEDEYMIAIDKPSGYIVYDPEDVKVSICNLLRYYYKQYKRKCEIIPVHRLDSDTSGCLIFAKDIITAAYLSRSFENNEVIKKYVAKVSGVINNEGTIDKNIGKDRHVNNKMVVCERGKKALTKYRLISTNKKESLVEAIPVTGRTHQIRVHLASIGNPIVGDKTYGSKVNNNRILLHCQYITFTHPIKEKTLTVYAPMPEEFKI